MSKILFFLLALFYLISTQVIANCSFKVVNHTTTNFEVVGLRGSIYNLEIPLCTKSFVQDEYVQANCKLPKDTLYARPQSANTCTSTNGWPVYLTFADSTRNCYSKPQETIDHDIVLNYPEDFICYDKT
jgi:hypothetical protein